MPAKPRATVNSKRAPKAATTSIVRWIASKRDGQVLPDEAIEAIVHGASRNQVPDYQLAALLMAIVWRGLSPKELSTWLRSMIDSGDRLSLDAVPGKKIDKHSTGGVGDNLSLCLAPLVAACGVGVPMLAGRALGHTGGTLDKLESIPGFRVDLSAKQYVRALSRAGWVIAGQTPSIAPADRVLYALRDATATVESIPLIASSILSKKIAGGADGLVMDVKMGDGAFLRHDEPTRELARTLVRLGRKNGLPTVALLTDMDQVLGVEIGNASEVREAIQILRGEGPPDTQALTVRLAAEMLLMAGVARSIADGTARALSAIRSGDGLDRFRLGVQAQGGNPRVVDDFGLLPLARKTWVLRATRSGWMHTIAARPLGIAATLLGAGRLQKSDRVRHGVGITLHVAPGARVENKMPLCTVYHDDARRFVEARPLVQQAFAISSKQPPERVLVREVIRS